jgi:hypothetical protein
VNTLGNINEIARGFTPDLKFLCRGMGVRVPFLPVDGAAEYKLFTQILVKETPRFDADVMALKWIERVSAETIFPKLPEQQRSYHKVWERNRQIQTSVQRTRSEIEILDILNKKQTPPELELCYETAQERQEGIGASDDFDADMTGLQPDNAVRPFGTTFGTLNYPAPVFPPALPLPPLRAKRSDSDGSLFVGLEWIGGIPLARWGCGAPKRLHGDRGPDRVKQTGRKCGICSSPTAEDYPDDGGACFLRLLPPPGSRESILYTNIGPNITFLGNFLNSIRVEPLQCTVRC